MKKESTTRKRALPLVIMALIALAAVVVPASPAAASVNKNGVLNTESGVRAGSFSGNMHYSARAQVSFNEFCLGNASLTDGYEVVALSIIRNYDGNGQVLTEDSQTHIASNARLGCFKHEFDKPQGTQSIQTELRVCLEGSGPANNTCRTVFQFWQ